MCPLITRIGANWKAANSGRSRLRTAECPNPQRVYRPVCCLFPGRRFAIGGTFKLHSECPTTRPTFGPRRAANSRRRRNATAIGLVERCELGQLALRERPTQVTPAVVRSSFAPRRAWRAGARPNRGRAASTSWTCHQAKAWPARHHHRHRCRRRPPNKAGTCHLP